MGWTYRHLARYGIPLEQAKADHVKDATRYGEGIKAELLAYEWHAKTFYAIIRLSSDTNEKYKTPKTFLRIDLIDIRNGDFGYKDGDESMGMYTDNPPSDAFRRKIFEYIPRAEGYAADWRMRNRVRFVHADQLDILEPAA